MSIATAVEFFADMKHQAMCDASDEIEDMEERLFKGECNPHKPENIEEALSNIPKNVLTMLAESSRTNDRHEFGSMLIEHINQYCDQRARDLAPERAEAERNRNRDEAFAERCGS